MDKNTLNVEVYTEAFLKTKMVLIAFSFPGPFIVVHDN